MTNAIQSSSALVEETTKLSFWGEHAGAIVEGITIAAILSAAALLWQYFIHPKILAWQEKHSGEERKQKLTESFKDIQFSYGYRIDFQPNPYISVCLPNNTPRSVVVREVAFIADSGGKYILWHNPKDNIDRQTTAPTRTGFDIPPFDEATWYYFAHDVTGEKPLLCHVCQVTFEYESSPNETSVCTISTPETKSKEIEEYFQNAWDAVQKKLLKNK